MQIINRSVRANVRQRAGLPALTTIVPPRDDHAGQFSQAPPGQVMLVRWAGCLVMDGLANMNGRHLPNATLKSQPRSQCF